jgi:hypothetical protein
MHGVALDQAAKTDDRVEVTRFGEPPGGDGNLEGPRHRHHEDLVVGHRGLGERVARTRQQP